MNASVNELLSNPAFRPLVLLDVLAVFLMIICLVFRRMRKGYYVEKARVVNDRLTETFLLGVNVEGKPLGSDLVVHTDPVWFSRILNMPDWHENHRLSAMAADVLG